MPNHRAARYAGGIATRPLLPATTSAPIRSDDERALVQADFDRVDQAQREALATRRRAEANAGRSFPASPRELGLMMQLGTLRARLDAYDQAEATGAARAHADAETVGAA